METRWIQRLGNFTKAMGQLQLFLLQPSLNHFEEQGLIKAFEYTYELAWKTLQDLYREKGLEGIIGPRPVIAQAFQDGIIQDGRGWMDMHQSRNLTSHTYNEETAAEIVADITNRYFVLLQALHVWLLDEAKHPNIEL